MKKKIKKGYKSRKWLNGKDSPSTGSVVAFCDDVKYGKKTFTPLYLEISDCSSKVRLHRTDADTVQEFIDKMKLLKAEVSKFINYLESNEV